MAGISSADNRFGDIAIEKQFLTKEILARGLVVQDLIYTRTKVHMAIGKVLKEMGVLSQEQIDIILDSQKNLETKDGDDECGCQLPKDGSENDTDGNTVSLSLTLPKDKLSAFVSPNKNYNGHLTLEALKDFLKARSVVFGLEKDAVLKAYLAQDPMPLEPFKIADGTPPTPGKPPEIIYHFDTDPLRIGTLKEDGTMDWKDRGDIPQVKAGGVLVEKTKGIPGQPGMSVCGKELPPPRLRNPKLKCGKGAKRAKDGLHIIAKINGTPKLSSDGKVFVFDVLNIKGDIGVETGHIEYEGYIEATGGVNSGYTVKGEGLRTTEIQNATIEVEEDLVCHGGIYGSTIKVGGDMKASHIHNCTIEALGDIVVQKELYDSTIETNGRCLIVEGKLIDSKIDAKKGIYAKDIGSEGSSPCKLVVGFDRKFERDLAACKADKEALEKQKAQAEASNTNNNDVLDAISTEIGEIAQEQDKFMLQKRQFEEQLRGEGPNPVDEDDEEERQMLAEMISELMEQNDELDTRVRNLMAKEDIARAQLEEFEKRTKLVSEQIEKTKEKIELLEATQKLNPGIPEVKASGTICNKTEIIGPHKEMTISEDMQRVRIAESKVDPGTNKYQIKISNLR